MNSDLSRCIQIFSDAFRFVQMDSRFIQMDSDNYPILGNVVKYHSLPWTN